MSPAPITPAALAREARRMLKSAADPRIAASQKRFFKPWEKIAFYGVATPDLRRIARDLHHKVRGVWTWAESLAFCDLLMQDRQIEAKGLGLIVLARYWRDFEAELARSARRWLEADLCCNWAVTDTLSGQILSPLLLKFPPLATEFAAWTSSKNLWVRRAGIVTFVKPSGKGAHLDTIYRLTTSLAADGEDLMHKACGWLLREAGRTDAERLEQYLLRHGAKLPRTTVRYAIERFPEALRRRILQGTRGSPRSTA